MPIKNKLLTSFLSNHFCFPVFGDTLITVFSNTASTKNILHYQVAVEQSCSILRSILFPLWFVIKGWVPVSPSLSSTFGHIYTERATTFPSNSLRGKWEEISFLCKCVRIKNFSRSSHEFKLTKLYLLFK